MFGELLERSGVDLEKFNAGLAKAKQEGTETNYVMEQLADLGLSSAYDEYVKLNPELAASTEATANFQIASAKLGTILSPLVTTFTNFITKGMEWVSSSPTVQGAIDSITTAFANIDIDKVINNIMTLGNNLRDTFSPIIQDVTSFLGTLWDKLKDIIGIQTAEEAFKKLNDAIKWIGDNSDAIISAIAGIVAALVTFNVLTKINATIATLNKLMIAYRTGTLLATLAQMGFNTALLTSPITWAAVAIGALVAAGILLYKNWDKVKVAASQLWQKIKESPFGQLLSKMKPIERIASAMKTAFEKVKTAFSNFKTAVTSFKMPKWVSTVGSTLSNAASRVRGMFNGSHATGLANVPFNGYAAQLHQGESVLTAKQSNALRQAGILNSNADGTPSLNMSGSQQQLNIQPSAVYLNDQVIGEIVFKVVDVLMADKQQTELYMMGVKG